MEQNAEPHHRDLPTFGRFLFPAAHRPLMIAPAAMPLQHDLGATDVVLEAH
jgi:hypothetical protein